MKSHLSRPTVGYLTQVFSILLLLASPVLARQVSIEGTLMNLRDITGDFPLASDFTLAFEIDETVPNSMFGPYAARYVDCIGAVTFTADAGGLVLSGTAMGSNKVEIYTDRPYNTPSALAEFSFTDPISGKSYEITANFYQKIGAPPANVLLTQDLSTSSFRLIEVQIRTEIPVSGTSDLPVVAGFGWARASAIDPVNGSPPEIRQSGYNHLLILGDSLSESKSAGSTDPNKVFDEGNINGPVWVQYLSWLMRIDYQEDLNFSAFGRPELPKPEKLAGYGFENALGTYWTHSRLFSVIIIVAFSDPPAEFFDSLAVEAQSDFLRAAELLHAMGAQDMLTLNMADISFAPLPAQFLTTPEKRGLIADFVDDVRPDFGIYVDDWFGGLFPGLRVKIVDPGVYLEEVRENPASFGITNMTATHIESGPQPLRDYFGNPGSTYFFWDDIAPTTKVHANLASQIYNAVFNTGSDRDRQMRRRIVNVTDDEVWLFGGQMPAGVPIDLQQSIGLSNLEWENAETFTTGDGNVFFVLPKPDSNKAFYRFSSALPD